MNSRSMSYVLVGAAALAAGLLMAGTSVGSLLPIVAVLACPLMMVVMMRGMGGHGHGHQPGREDRPGPGRQADVEYRPDAGDQHRLDGSPLGRPTSGALGGVTGGEGHDERRALAGPVTRGGDPSAVLVDQGAHDREADA